MSAIRIVVLAMAAPLGMAGVEPDTVEYVEAFGLGIALADQIEATALASVFGPGATRRQWCALGSVKANVGHLSQAAGVVSLIKAVLALEAALLPPTPTCSTPGPTIETDGPFYVNTTLSTWPRGTETIAPRIASAKYAEAYVLSAMIPAQVAPSRTPIAGSA